MMGKKGVKKTKELSVAITESSAAEPETPRKRGRPRKVVEGQQMVKEFQELEGPDFKKGKTERLEGEEEEEEEGGGEDKEKMVEEMKQEVVVGSSSSSKSIKQEDKDEDNKQQESSSPKKQQQRKSRARKKGKPRKSS